MKLTNFSKGCTFELKSQVLGLDERITGWAPAGCVLQCQAAIILMASFGLKKVHDFCPKWNSSSISRIFTDFLLPNFILLFLLCSFYVLRFLCSSQAIFFVDFSVVHSSVDYCMEIFMSDFFWWEFVTVWVHKITPIISLWAQTLQLQAADRGMQEISELFISWSSNVPMTDPTPL